ncbi:hypothetical protein BJ508DRAFT_412680 [Ascobolus immersus RN42]|uniref:Acyl-coenzyme A thioesterase THEM4 n=1 Tax=Ascobolus immersus RN42 TaxID=1160509 RepID=A0A3N4IKB7_ASCIM|nr:hypothetical protein BJ508DRAFT_412680 [Ascobolus immersus RN42]
MSSESSSPAKSLVTEDWVGQVPKVDTPFETLAYLKRHAPWASVLVNAPEKYIPVLVPYKLPQNTTENTFLREIMPPTVPHHIALYHEGLSSFPSPDQPSTQVVAATAAREFGTIFTLFALTSLSNGYADTAHGGLIGVLFDELLGMCIACEMETFAFTLETKVAYKKRIATPKVVLGRGRIIKEEGRKVWVTAELVDGETGEVHATAESLWLKSREGMARL